MSPINIHLEAFLAAFIHRFPYQRLLVYMCGHLAMEMGLFHENAISENIKYRAFGGFNESTEFVVIFQ